MHSENEIPKVVGLSYLSQLIAGMISHLFAKQPPLKHASLERLFPDESGAVAPGDHPLDALARNHHLIDVHTPTSVQESRELALKEIGDGVARSTAHLFLEAPRVIIERSMPTGVMTLKISGALGGALLADDKDAEVFGSLVSDSRNPFEVFWEGDKVDFTRRITRHLSVSVYDAGVFGTERSGRLFPETGVESCFLLEYSRPPCASRNANSGIEEEGLITDPEALDMIERRITGVVLRAVADFEQIKSAYQKKTKKHLRLVN